MRKLVLASAALVLLGAGAANASGIPALQSDNSGTVAATRADVSRGFLIYTDQNDNKRVVNQYAGQRDTANSYGATYGGLPTVAN